MYFDLKFKVTTINETIHCTFMFLIEVTNNLYNWFAAEMLQSENYSVEF